MAAPAIITPPPRRPAPSLTGRALLSVTFLLGFYVLALGSVAMLVGANVALYRAAGRASTQLVLVTVCVGAAVVRGVFFVTRSDVADLPGVDVDPRGQPELTRLVRAVAADMGTAPPTRIRLVPEVNAAVTQTGGFLGLRGGERIMLVGVPLLQSLTVDQLRGVIAHELGHYAGGDTRLGALTYRAGASIRRTVEHLGSSSLLARLFAAYGHRYFLISQRVRRQQELSADAAAVRIAGRESHVGALRRVEAVSAAFDHFVRFYLAPLWRQGCDARDAFAGFRALLTDPVRHEHLEAMASRAPGEVADPYDSHPSLSERVAYAGTLPEGASAATDGRPARALLADPDAVERQVGALLTRDVTGRAMERLVDWDASAAEVYAAALSEDGDELLRAAAAVAEDPSCASLAAAIVLVEEGMGEELAAALTGPLDGTQEQVARCRRLVLAHHLGCAIGWYLARERGHRWTVSWSRPLTMVDGRGKPVDPFELAASLLDDPSSGGGLRRSLGGIARLHAFRLGEEAVAGPRADQSEPGPAAVVHVVADVAADRRHYDLVLTTGAVVLHPVSGGIGAALRRLMATQGVTGPAVAAAERRLGELFSRPAAALGQAPGAVVLSLESLRGLRKGRGWVVHLEVAGREQPWRLRCPSKGDRDRLLAAVKQLAEKRLADAA